MQELTDWRPPTETELAEIVNAAYQMGLDGDHYDEESRTIQWDDLYRDFEGAAFATDFGLIDLGEDYDGPLVKAVRTAYKRGRKDQVT